MSFNMEDRMMWSELALTTDTAFRWPCRKPISTSVSSRNGLDTVQTLSQSARIAS